MRSSIGISARRVSFASPIRWASIGQIAQFCIQLCVSTIASFGSGA
jgi:hypothetical protein